MIDENKTKLIANVKSHNMAGWVFFILYYQPFNKLYVTVKCHCLV